jgi:lipopolysaccharide/colanic/teichoic acid biosynthesis glycosyltransferase
MIATADKPQHAEHPTVWGLRPLELHDRFWAARGVQVIRHGQQSAPNADAELFLLTDARSLTIFRLAQLIDTLNWLKPRLLFARLRSARELGYRERVLTDDEGRFLRFERVYGGSDTGVARVALTPGAELAGQWAASTDSPPVAWRRLRRAVPRQQRATVSIEGSIFDRDFDPEVMQFVRELVQVWRRPDATIRRARAVEDAAWSDVDTPVNPGTRFVGPVWVGAGRHLDGVESVVGPAILWDEPDHRPRPDDVQWEEIETAPRSLERPVKLKKLTSAHRAGKRAFDVAFALAAILVTLPLYPLVMLAIWLEDGPPFFFAHRRETMGGREFPCIKFRTMRKDAEHIKKQLMAANQADGPQFFMENDPRLTRVGRVLRQFNVDEFPQFLNVLLGHMSIVGPRPSPHSENQYCPPWREARLSVRPGVTGLWQVMRSRRQGMDFQEWIRYDIEYVENVSWRMDFRIIAKTFGKLAGRGNGA